MNRDENDFDWLSDRPKLSERELLEWCAGISDCAAAKLQRLQSAEAEAKAKARDDRELLEFIAAISGKPEHEREPHALLQNEAEERARPRGAHRKSLIAPDSAAAHAQIDNVSVQFSTLILIRSTLAVVSTWCRSCTRRSRFSCAGPFNARRLRVL